ncbi:hypothetical protein ACVWW1_008376 [Bradyrhizobium sp. JR3.5]
MLFPKLAQNFSAIQAVSIITWMEVMVGADPDVEAATHNFLSGFDIVAVDEHMQSVLLVFVEVIGSNCQMPLSGRQRRSIPCCSSRAATIFRMTTPVSGRLTSCEDND